MMATRSAPLRHSGVAHRTWQMLDVDDRTAIARSANVDPEDLADLDRSTSSAHRRTRKLAALAAPALASLRDALGAAVDDPTADELRAAAVAISDRHTEAEIRLVLALAVEARFPARQQILELVAADDRFAIAMPRETVAIPLRDRSVADPARRANRRERHRHDVEERRRRAEQRARARVHPEATRLDLGESGRAEADDQSADVVELHVPRRIRDPRLPAWVDGFTDPVGRVGAAHISWSPGHGKRRPVVIVGAHAEHLWVRPCYSNDVCAGGWRAVGLLDWRECGLDHLSFVDLEVHRLSRDAVDIGAGRLTLSDWNRVCRREFRAA